MIKTVNALNVEATKREAAHQHEILELNKKHYLEITEKLTQLEIQRKSHDAYVKELNMQHEHVRAELQLT
jgi:hypothetical protein